MGTTILRLRHLTLVAGTQPVVEDLSLDISLGEIVALTGPSGSGKTSLALAMLGLLPPGIKQAAGSITWSPPDGLVMNLPEDAIEWRTLNGTDIGYIPQDVYGSFDPVMPVGQLMSVTVARRMKMPEAEAETRLRSIMPKLGLADVDRIWRAWPHQLSGGQLQRCLVCLSVAMSPSLLITDEPTSAIDRMHQLEILDLLRKLRDEFGMAILCITHEPGLVRAIADREVRLLGSAPPERNETSSAEVRFSPEELVLEANQLVFTYRDGRFRKAAGATVGPVSFQLHRGQCLGIIGESGSGKSTLAQLLVGWYQGDAGILKWRDMGVDVRDPDALHLLRAHVQLVMQDGRGALHPYMPVRRLLKEAGRLRGKDERHHPGRWAEALAEVGLSADVLDRRSRALSGGECLRVNIARALLLEPDVLVCDESTSALDPVTRDGILTLLAQLKTKRGLAIVFVTHDETVITRLADHVLVLSAGKVVEQGAAREVTAYPTHEVTKKIFAAGATFFGPGRH